MLKLIGQLADPGFKIKPAFSSKTHTLSHMSEITSLLCIKKVFLINPFLRNIDSLFYVFTHTSTPTQNTLTSIILRCISIFSCQMTYPLREENLFCIFPPEPRCHFTMLKPIEMN